jgi:transcriptional regulator with XRE-family HTH domain
MECQPGTILREARLRGGLSQRALALRAGTSQDAISRIERGREAPTVGRLAQLLAAMGEQLIVESIPLESPLDSAELAVARELSLEERLRESASWNLAATKLEIAGERARRRAAG